MTQRNIETGVDKLVDLINRRKRVSLNDAANELGVSVPVIQEWADFLEEESLITIEYKLSRTYLCERKLSKGEVEKKAKEYSSKKDAFTRKVETALKSLQKESEGFEQVKEEFNKLKDVIGGDIDQVREELQELKHYEDLKKNIDKDIMQQKLDFQEMLENLHRQIAAQQKKHDVFIDEISAEKTKIDEAKVELGYLEKRGDNIKKRVDALKEIVKSIDNKIDEQKRVIRDSLEKIDFDIQEADKLQKDLRFRMSSELEPIMNAMKEKEEKILTVQDSVLKKMADKNKEIDKYKLESMHAAEKFNIFFERKAKTQELITALDKDKSELEKELQGLIMKATCFNLSIKSSDVKDYVKELQKSFDDIEHKRSSFIKKLNDLTALISRKE
jgi:predicted ArsR family transcriptional regulator